MGRTTDLILFLKLKQVTYFTVPVSMSVYQGCDRLVKMSLWDMPHAQHQRSKQINHPDFNIKQDIKYPALLLDIPYVCSCSKESRFSAVRTIFRLSVKAYACNVNTQEMEAGQQYSKTELHSESQLQKTHDYQHQKFR